MIDKLQIEKFLNEAFTLCAREQSQDVAHELIFLRMKFQLNTEREPFEQERFEQACHDGERARQLTAELKRQFDQYGNSPDTINWLEARQREASNERIHDHLKKIYDELHQKIALRANKSAFSSQNPSTLTALKQAPGKPHPNSLRHLAPSAHWQIVIDETGSTFNEDANHLNMDNTSLGRMVAVAIPKTAKLPDLWDFHAVDEDPERVDKVVQSLLKGSVGIFGFTVLDPATQANSWIGHVIHLMRWVLAQLPLPTEQNSTVEFLIEKRQFYSPETNQGAIREALESEFRRLDPKRYGKMRLIIDFIDKSHPYNGYPDAVAFTWGSTKEHSIERLKKTGWLGHCLLRPSDRALQRAYTAVWSGQPLAAETWYELCTAAASEPETGLLRHCLHQIGANEKKKPRQWNEYLQHVRYLMRAKKYLLNELAYALDWLEVFAGEQCLLSAAERFTLESARITIENHRGAVNTERHQRCKELIEAYIDEAPFEAFDAILRIASSSTNVFQFEAMRPLLTDWLARPIAIGGLLNHAKMHSTLGQIEAFMGRTEAALGHFDRALQALGRLSDPAQAKRELAQTQSYRLLAQLSTTAPEEKLQALAAPQVQSAADAATAVAPKLELEPYFKSAIKKSKPNEISRSVAHSGHDGRYAHHIWLRILTTFPSQYAEARKAYLELQHQWQYDEHHPWPLINAYRGWLLHDSGLSKAAAQHFTQAIELCQADGEAPVLLWMAEVLRLLAQALHIKVTAAPPPCDLEHLAKLLPDAPHEALARFAQQAQSATCSRLQIHAALRQCLPFNFH